MECKIIYWLVGCCCIKTVVITIIIMSWMIYNGGKFDDEIRKDKMYLFK